MRTQPNSSSRRGRVSALLALLGVVAALGSAQPPDSEPRPTPKAILEEEDPRGGGVKKRIVVDEEGLPARPGLPGVAVGSPPSVRLDELVRAADESQNPGLRTFFLRHSVPFDTVNGTRVRPLPFRKSELPADVNKEFRITPLDDNGRPLDVRQVRVGSVRELEHYESIVLARADALLKSPSDAVTPAEKLAAAEKLLAAALRFHDFAREQQVRKGKGWDEYREPLVTRLKEVRLEMLRAAVTANDPNRVRSASTILMNAYPNDPAVAREVAVARAGEALRLLQTKNHTDHVRAKELLDELENRFPGAGGETVQKARAQLREIAQVAFERAKGKKAAGDTATARDELARASALDPTLDGIRELQRELRVGYPILYVGVRQYPVYMTPVTARVDSERQAVELMFEGLLEEVPEASGAVRYRPGAALAMSTASPGGRDFLLRTFDRDSAGRLGFDSQDVVGTLKFLSLRADTWAAYPLPWLSGLATPRDATSVRIGFSLGHPDPRATLTFKLLPARWLAENKLRGDDLVYAERPYGTGPFKFYAAPKPEGNNPREMVFVDNPVYGRWRDRTGLPHLREIRLVDVSQADPPALFRADKLHILPDIPTADIEKYQSPGLVGRVQVVKAAVNRRVHILAVNWQRPELQSKDLRQGISMAIDRDEILQRVYRAGKTPDVHRPMTGPYPPGSWVDPQAPGAVQPLTNRDLAVDRLKKYLSDAGAGTAIELAYPKDDPLAAEACNLMKTQIESLTKEGGKPRLNINLVGVPTRELMVRVQDEHRYDLAYVPFDYPDDWYPFGLGAALDPNAWSRGGRNWFKFLGRGTNPDAKDQQLGQLLSELRAYRDFSQILPRAVQAGQLFNESLPFIPLWQLDRHMVVSNRLKVYVDDGGVPVSPGLLNPTLLFQGVARWRLD